MFVINRGKTISFSPGVWIEIAKNDDAVFASFQISIFIEFYGRNYHNRNGISDGFLQKAIFILGDDFTSMLLKIIKFFPICCIPKVFIH